MLEAEDFVLKHAWAPYDPAKAHEYYMRTRQLHPRAKSAKYEVKRADGKTATLNAKQLAEQKAYAEHRVTAIHEKLKTLKAELVKKIDATHKAKAKPTAADKAKASRDAKQYRNSHKQELKTKAKQKAASSPQPKSSSSSTSTTAKKAPETVDSLATKIVATKASLKAAVEKQRELATSKRIG